MLTTFGIHIFYYILILTFIIYSNNIFKICFLYFSKRDNYCKEFIKLANKRVNKAIKLIYNLLEICLTKAHYDYDELRQSSKIILALDTEIKVIRERFKRATE